MGQSNIKYILSKVRNRCIIHCKGKHFDRHAIFFHNPLLSESNSDGQGTFVLKFVENRCEKDASLFIPNVDHTFEIALVIVEKLKYTKKKGKNDRKNEQRSFIESDHVFEAKIKSFLQEENKHSIRSFFEMADDEYGMSKLLLDTNSNQW